MLQRCQSLRLLPTRRHGKARSINSSRFALFVALVIVPVAAFPQGSMQRLVRISGDNGNIISLSAGNPAATYTLTLPPNINPSTNAASVLFGSGSGLLDWMPSSSSDSGYVVQLIDVGGGVLKPRWVTPSAFTTSGNYWSISGNAPTTAWNGTSGNFLGTTNAVPLVLATTNTSTAQPIELFTNNAERMRIAPSGEVGIGVTPFPGALLHVGGTAGTANVRFNSLSGANLPQVFGANEGLLVADANGDLTKRDPSVLNRSYVQYDVGSPQAQSVTRSNYLFNVAYDAAAGDAGAAGALILSEGGATNRNATALTLGATASGVGTATGLTVTASGGAANNAIDATGNLRLLSSGGTSSSLVFQNPAGTFTSTFTAGAQVANINYTLPSAAPVSDDYILASSTVGTLTWLDPSTIIGSGFWRLAGNSGTDPTNDFLGTTDAIDLELRVNSSGASSRRLRLFSAGGLQRFDGTTRPNNPGNGAVDLQSSRSAITQVASGGNSVIAGGSNNTAGNDYATVGGGSTNTATGQYSTIAGGQNNTVPNNNSTVGGGSTNAASGNASTIAGGVSNTIQNDNGTIAGGSGNTVSGNGSAVGGGTSNTASGSNSVIPGGNGLTVGSHSFGYSASTANTNVTSIGNNIAYFGDANLLIGNTDNTARQLRFYEPNSSATYTGTNYSSILATAQTADIIYTLPSSQPSLNQVLTATSISGAGPYNISLSWAAPSVSGSFVNYNTATPQNTATIVGGNYLFNVAYAASATTTNALGATISSVAGTSGNTNATGLTLSSTANGAGTSTGLAVTASGGSTKNAIDATGNVRLLSTGGTASSLSLQNPAATFSSTFTAGAQTANLNYTLPTSAPTSNGQVLSSSTAGVLSWASVSSGGGGLLDSGTATRIAFWGPGPGLTNGLMDDSYLYWDNTNKRLMLGNSASPNTRLDVDGDFATRQYNYPTSVSGTLNNVNFDGSNNQTSFVRIQTATGGFNITGVVGGADGKLLTIMNATSQIMTMVNQSASSTAANRILTGTGVNIPIPSGGIVNMIYSATDSRWQVRSMGGVSGWLYTGNSGLTDGLNNFHGTLDNTPIRFVAGLSGAPRTRMVLDTNGNLLFGANSGTAAFSSGATGRFAFGDSLTSTRLNSVPTFLNRVFNMIDKNAVVRIWRFDANTGGTDPAVEFIGGTNDLQSNTANTWWDVHTTGTPGVAGTGTRGQGEMMAFRRRTGASDSVYMGVWAGGNVGIGDNGTGAVIVPNRKLVVTHTDDLENGVREVLALQHNNKSGDTPADGLGTGIVFRGETSTTESQDMARISALWSDVTNSSRSGDLTFETVNNAGSMTERVRIQSDGEVGVNTSAPNTYVDINGDLALRYSQYGSLNSGNNNNLSVGSYSYVRVTAAGGGSTITGISGGTNGKVLIIYNTANNLTIANLNSNSSSSNQIRTMSGANIVTNGEGNITFIFDDTLDKWIVTSFMQ